MAALSGTQRGAEGFPPRSSRNSQPAAEAAVAAEGEGARLRAELSAETTAAARERAQAKLLATMTPPLRLTEFSRGNVSVSKRFNRCPENSKRIVS